MQRKIFKSGNSLVVSLPKEAIEEMQISKGTNVSINYDRINKQLVIEPLELDQVEGGIDEEFSQQVSEFIEQYQPALNDLEKIRTTSLDD